MYWGRITFHPLNTRLRINMHKVLMYHSIGVKSNGEVGAGLYSVSMEDFREQMEYIKALKDMQVTITFDDGDVTNYKYAYPILKEMRLSAYFFIIVSRVGTRGYMKWEEIKELRDNGMIIGSHGITHKILMGLKDKDLDYEIKASKRFMEDNLGHSIDYFSVPRGFYNKKIIEKAKEAGYKAIFTSNVKDDDGFRIGRISVKSHWDIKSFNRVLNSGFSLKEKAVELIKDSSKRILGAGRYDKIRTGILKK